MRLVCLAVVVLAAGCSSYVPRPLDERALLEELRFTHVEARSQGATPDELVASALLYNVDLRALRKKRAVAEGAVVSAAAWRNPQLRLSFEHLLSGDPLALGLGLRFFPPPPGEKEAAVERARARARRVLAEIEDAEDRTAASVRIAHARLLMLEDKARIAETAAKIRERVVALEEQRLALKLATRFDVVLAQLDRESVESDRQAISLEQQLVRAELGGLVGSSNFTVALARAPIPPEPPARSVAALEELAVARRADLRVVRERYEEAEQDVRLESARDRPWPRFLQPGVSHVTDGPDLELGASIDLPFAGVADGPVEVAKARRDRAREEVTDRLQIMRVEVQRALTAVRESALHYHRWKDKVEPALSEAEQLVQEGMTSDQVDLLRLEVLGARLLAARNASADAELAYRTAVIELELATGTVLDPGAR